MALTALKVKYAKPGRHTDGRGLCLLVQPSGTRTWILRMQKGGRRRDYGLGSVLDVSLADARYAAAVLRKRILAGFDPVEARRMSQETMPSFETVARECYDALKEGWKNRRSASWISSLENHVFPIIGKMPVDKVDSACVLKVLSPIWLKIPDTSRRVFQRIRAVLDYAHIKGWRPTEASLRSVRKGLPRQTRQISHFAAMPYADVPAFMPQLVAAPTVGREALRFTIYTAVRSNETRHAIWPEFDLDQGVWIIPDERMKAGKTHVVPLAPPVVALLRRIWKERDSDTGLVFSNNGRQPLSDMTLTKVLRDLGIEKFTVHGFRSAFADWAAERTRFPKEIVEKALAHEISNKVEAAYRRTDFLEKRRTLMLRWAEYLDRMPAR